jgi:hypothetical protein
MKSPVIATSSNNKKWHSMRNTPSTCPRSSNRHAPEVQLLHAVQKTARQKNSTSKTEWTSNRHAPEVQLLHAVQKTARQKQSEVQTDMIRLIARRSGSYRGKFRLCNSGCVTHLRHRSSTWKQQEVQLLHWMNFRWKSFKPSRVWKKWSRRKSCVFTAAFHRYITCSIPVSGWRATSKKQCVKKQSEVRVDVSMKFKFFTRCIFEDFVSR